MHEAIMKEVKNDLKLDMIFITMIDLFEIQLVSCQ